MSADNNAKNPGTLTEEEIAELQDSVDMGDWGDVAPPRKAKAFWPSAMRLLGRFVTEKAALTAVFIMVVIAVVLSVWAPSILGDAMNVIFAGFVSSDMPSTLTRDEVIQGLAAPVRPSTSTCCPA